MSGRAVSISGELSEIRAAVQGARMLADLLRFHAAQDEDDELHIPQACSAVLALAETRLQLVVRALTGHAEPAVLLADHNRVENSSDVPEGEDLLLPIEPPGRRRKPSGG
ncbi:MAG: hypothetical protein OEZ06_28035 [Myxococcales bacterium]|nr:hypothetical protein [Myxococcales bacterium]